MADYNSSYTGLQIDEAVGKVLSLPLSSHLHYAVCDTAAGTQTKAITISGITELTAGLSVRVIMADNQTYNGVPKLQINSLAAKNIQRASGTNAGRYEWIAGTVLDLVYDGTSFLIVNRSVATETYYGVTKLVTSAISDSVSLALTARSLNNFWHNNIASYNRYSDSSAYAVGDRIRREYNVYECNTEIGSGGEAWTAEHWTLVPTIQAQLDRHDAAFTSATASGASVAFTAPAAGLPLKSLIVNIEPVRAGSGDPSPSNVRAISGRTAASVVISPTQQAADGTTVSVTFPAEAGTVYGGTLDLQSGLLTVDRHGKKIKDFSWTYSSSYQRFQSSSVAPAVKPAEAQSRVLAGLLGETYSACAASALQNNGVAVTISGTMLVKDANYTTVSAFTAAMGEYLIVYPLAEPVVYQIEPHTIATLLGTNNIWADCGDVSVTWGAYIEAASDRADRANGALLSLMACIAPIENGNTASQAYAQSAYFFRGGNFCKAKTAIASGAAFTLDTNYEVTTIAAALIALQS